MFGKIKLKVATISLVAIALTFLMQSTLAFYTTVGKATNVVTSGDIQLLIHEKTNAGTDFPEEGVYVLPGDVVSKMVYIENGCDHPFYLRVKLVYGINSDELPAEECLSLDIDENNWKYKDGWYYYTGVVNPHETTPNVFSCVEMIGSKIGNEYRAKTLSLSVQAQAVQSENNPITDGDTTTANGWPEQEG